MTIGGACCRSGICEVLVVRFVFVNVIEVVGEVACVRWRGTWMMIIYRVASMLVVMLCVEIEIEKRELAY